MPDTAAPKSRIISAGDALREAMDICLERDPSVYLMGEGVADPKAIFGTTAGLIQKYGPDRVVEMPVAENGLTGVAIGSAMMGRRPVMVHQRVDFALLALEQIFNNAAKTFYVTGGRHKVPLTVRLIIGRGWGQGPEHSQSLESVFAHFPGLKVVMPASAREAKGMLIAAVEDDNPVIVLEHRWVHYVTGDVPEGHFTTPLIGPRAVKSGDDVTVVATGYMLFEAMRAADALAEAGIGVDLFDLRVLRPLDLTPIFESVRRTGRLIIVDTGWKLYGAGAEVSAQVVEHCFDALKAAPIRLGLPDHPTPSSRGLIVNFYPHSQTIVDAVAQLVGDREGLDGVRRFLAGERARLAIDVPDPAFRGPF
jgi:pyruvate dehydrogenase E1 component beta subunit